MAVSDQSKDKISEFVSAQKKLGKTMDAIFTTESEEDVLIFAESFDGKDLAELINSLGNSSTIKMGDLMGPYALEKHPDITGMVVLHIW